MSKLRIPKRLREEAFEFMDAHNDDDLPDGAWFATLEAAGDTFIDMYGLWGDGNDMAHWYLEQKGKEQEASS